MRNSTQTKAGLTKGDSQKPHTIPILARRVQINSSTGFVGMVCSLAFHLIMAILVIVGLPTVRRDLNTDYAVVADVVPISELTNVKVRETNRKDDTQQQTKKAPKSVEVAKAEEKAKPEESKKTPVPEEAEKIPDKNIKKEDKKPKEPEKPKEAEKKKDDKPKKKDDSFERAILKSLEEEQKKKQDKKIDKSFKEMADALKGETNKDYNSNLPMSMSEIDAIRSQISKNWNTTSFSGSVDARTMQVVVEIKLDMDGRVISAKPVMENHNSPYYRPFVESAVRAVRSTSPLQNLTKEKYATWKEIAVTFDASGMIY